MNMALKHRKLGRTSDQRRAMLRAMTTYLLENGQIKTTLTRAKEVAPVCEKMISLAKKNNLAAYRRALAFISKEDVAKRSSLMRSAPSTPPATAAIPGSSASAPAGGTRRRWRSFSWSKSQRPPGILSGRANFFRKASASFLPHWEGWI